MLRQLQVLWADGTSPYRNIALERHLLERVRPGCCILYLWRNARTVVIGRNQSAHGEVDIARLEADGGHLARRSSGGGAVYHDLGNLNFTFLARHADYDVSRQTEVILRAVRSCGIEAERTGRNDLLACGRKFSGHAYYRSADACYHHGTLMVDVDVERMGRYLRPAADKLEARGVRSVRARVGNLRDMCPGLDALALGARLEEAFGSVFGLPPERLEPAELDSGAIETLTRRFSSREWLLGDERAFEHEAHARFAWGGVTLRYTLEGERIADCALCSDGLAADFLAEVPALLRGCALDASALEAALLCQPHDEAQRRAGRDIIDMLLLHAGGI